MSRAFVLGNGSSRLLVNLQILAELGPTYGCNALYREFVPTVLISTDRPISERIQDSGYARQNRFLTRKLRPDSGAQSVPQAYYGFSSGPIAVAVAAQDHHRAVYLIGFDMGPSATGHFNNVYADTEFYKKSSAGPTYTGNWQRQIVTVAGDFPNTNFFRVTGPGTADISELRGIRNMAHITMEDFLNRINNTKEL